MDPRVEEKLDNFENILRGFEDKWVDGDQVSEQQISILYQALGSIIINHTIAKWWSDDMRERIDRLKQNKKRIDIDFKFDTAFKSSDDSVIQDATDWWNYPGMGRLWNLPIDLKKKIRVTGTPSGDNWLWQKYQQTYTDFSTGKRILGEAFVFNKSNKRIELKNPTPELIEDFKNYTWRNDNEIQDKVTDSQPSNRAEDLPFVFFCGGRQGGKSLCGRKYNGSSPDITQGRLSSED